MFSQGGRGTKNTIVFEKRWDDRPSIGPNTVLDKRWDARPPFKPYAYIAHPDPTHFAKRKGKAQKRPPFWKNDGTPERRSGPTTV